MSEIISGLLSLSGWPVYVFVGLLAFLEAAAFVGLVVPGETALVVGGVLASRGNVSLPLLLGVAAVAVVAGDSVGYAVGHHFGPVIERSRVGRRIGARRWAAAHAYVERRGASAVFLGRWVGVMRALVPSIAGMVHMPYRRFFIANAAGGITWGTTVVVLGYVAGGSLAGAEHTLGHVSVAVGALLVALVVLAVVRHRLRGVREDAREDGVRAGLATDDVRDAGQADASGGATVAPVAAAATTSRSDSPSTSSVAPAPAPAHTRWAGARWWLPGAIAATGALAVIELIDAVREGGDIAVFDPVVTSEAVAQRTPALTVIAQTFTFIGGFVGLSVLTVALVAWLAWRGERLQALVVTATMGLSLGLTVLLKNLVGRVRPPIGDVIGQPDPTFAFPSGHTLNSTVLFGLIAGLALARVRSWGARIAIVGAWLAGCLAVALSRIYLGYHWMTDVMGGWSLGLVLLGLLALGWAGLGVYGARRRASLPSGMRRTGPT